MAKRPEELSLRLEAAASPARVVAAASLFRDVLAAIDPALADDDVTLVVSNRELVATVRGRSGAGGRVVDRMEGLVRNPMHALQETPELAQAALHLASHARKFLPLEASFLDRNGAEISRIDYTLVTTMHAVAKDAHRAEEGGDLRGETVVFSRVYRFGRVDEGRKPMARIHVDRRALEIRVDPGLEDSFWAAAQSGEILPIRLQGTWIEIEGALQLEDPIAVSIDTTFTLWTGREFLEEAQRHADLLSKDDFDRMLWDLRGD